MGEPYKVKTGDTLERVARMHGLTWQELAVFNWGTSEPAEVNRAIHTFVGSKKKTRKGNFIFDSADAPGILFIPKKDVKQLPATARKQATPPQPAKPPSRSESHAAHASSSGETHWCADNLAIAAGWSQGFQSIDTSKLVSKVLPGWLKDYHPTVLARGYYVLVLEPLAQSLTLYPSNGIATHRFKLKPGVELHGLVGVYAMFEGVNDGSFVDMASLSYGIKQPGNAAGSLSLFDLVSTPEQLKKAVNAHAGQAQLLYFLPLPGQLAVMALYGGKGQLEDYGKDFGLNTSIHQRNVVVSQSLAHAYEAYVDGYVKLVKEVDSEDALRALGPPLAPYQMRFPAGITDDQRMDLFKASGKASIEPWLAIAHKLDDLYNRKAQGYPFVRFKVKYRHDAVKTANTLKKKVFPQLPDVSNKVPVEVEVETQMDIQVVDGDLQVITKGDTLVRATLKKGEVFKQVTGNGFPMEISFKQSLGMLEKQVVSIKLGKFQIERDSVGKSKLSLEALTGVVADAEFNDRTGEFGGGFTLKAKDLAVSLRKRAQEFSAGSPEASRLQRWAKWLESLASFELQLMAGFVGTREETILSILARSPGFFERRSLQELFNVKTQWNTLTLDEQSNLVTLGWSQDNWDRKYIEGAKLPESVGKPRASLSAAEKLAMVSLGFHSYEEYGVIFRKKRSEFSHYTF